MNADQKDRDPIVVCCCMDKGHSEMKTSFEKTVYYPNEIAIATAKINNKDCQIAVKEVRFCLKMMVELKTHGAFGGDRFNKEYIYARSSIVGPGAGDEHFKNEFQIDLSKIKYDVIKEKKKKGEMRTIAPQNQFMMS